MNFVCTNALMPTSSFGGPFMRKVKGRCGALAIILKPLEVPLPVLVELGRAHPSHREGKEHVPFDERLHAHHCNATPSLASRR